jgi:hypothetical protein
MTDVVIFEYIHYKEAYIAHHDWPMESSSSEKANNAATALWYRREVSKEGFEVRSRLDAGSFEGED